MPGMVSCPNEVGDLVQPCSSSDIPPHPVVPGPSLLGLLMAAQVMGLSTPGQDPQLRA